MSRTAVVIGAGITGTLTGHSLQKAGWQVTILEAKATGAGSSSRTAAGIRQQFTTAETVLGMRYAVSFYKDFKAQVGGERAPIRQNGYVFLGRGPRGPIEERVRVQHSAGLTEVELLSADEAHARFAWLDPHAFDHATWCPTDGFLFPADVYNEAAAAMQRAGGKLLQGTPVTGARHENGRIAAVASGDRWFPADLFVDATNAWSPRLGETLRATALPISPLKRYLWFLERAGSLTGAQLEAMPLVVTPGGAYCRPENEDSLLTGWAHTAGAEPEFTYEDQDSDRSGVLPQDRRGLEGVRGLARDCRVDSPRRRVRRGDRHDVGVLRDDPRPQPVPRIRSPRAEPAAARRLLRTRRDVRSVHRARRHATCGSGASAR